MVFANRPDPNTPIEGGCTEVFFAFYGGDVTVSLAWYNKTWKAGCQDDIIKYYVKT